MCDFKIKKTNDKWTYEICQIDGLVTKRRFVCKKCGFIDYTPDSRISRRMNKKCGACKAIETIDEIREFAVREHWTLIDVTKTKGSLIVVTIKCQKCGSEREVNYSQLKKKSVPCWECRNKEFVQFVETTTTWNVIEISDISGKGKQKLKVECRDCGTKKEHIVTDKNAYYKCKCQIKKEKEDKTISKIKKRISGCTFQKTWFSFDDKGRHIRWISMKCNDCGHVHSARYSFWHNQTIYACPNCKPQWKHENEIGDILSEKASKIIGLEVIGQARFDECKDKGKLPFDFGVFYNGNIVLLIEHQGIQHYSPVDAFGGVEGFEYTKRHDAIKQKFAASKKIPLIEIPYWEDDMIEEKCSEIFCTILDIITPRL